MEFDKDNSESVFLRFVANEFVERGTQLRSDLATKTYAHELVAAENTPEDSIRIPDKKHVLTDIKQLSAELLGERSVLKYAHGWSARGVMLLEQAGDDKYFEHLKLKTSSLNAIVEQQTLVASSFKNSENEWIIEEFLESAQPGSIPFDYKFYVFQKQIGLIVQIDRNTNPPKMCLFNGNFEPLYEGVDYLLDRERAQKGIHLLPQHIVQLSHWALRLAQKSDAPFVSLDLFDTLSGPAFGEFTFSPGATHRRMFRFSHSVIEHLDTLFSQAQEELSGKTVSYSKSLSRDIQNCDRKELAGFSTISTDKYSLLSAYQYNSGGRAAVRVNDIYKGRFKDTKSEHKKCLLGWLVNASEKILDGFKNKVYG